MQNDNNKVPIVINAESLKFLRKTTTTPLCVWTNTMKNEKVWAP